MDSPFPQICSFRLLFADQTAKGGRLASAGNMAMHRRAAGLATGAAGRCRTRQPNISASMRTGSATSAGKPIRASTGPPGLVAKSAAFESRGNNGFTSCTSPSHACGNGTGRRRLGPVHGYPATTINCSSAGSRSGRTS